MKTKKIFNRSMKCPFDVYTNLDMERTITFTFGINPEILFVTDFSFPAEERLAMVKRIHREGTDPRNFGGFPDEMVTDALSLSWNDPLVKKCYGRVRDKEYILVITREIPEPGDDIAGMGKEIKVSGKQRLIVFSAGWNCEMYARKHLRSVRRQTYPNFVHVVVDDASTDKTNSIIRHNKYPRMALHRNEKNMKWVANAVRYLPEHIKSEEDVIVLVDMDDWLSSKRSLSIIAAAYERNDCWVTYGSFAYRKMSGKVAGKVNRPIYTPEMVQKRSFRKVSWRWWHPKTFKAFLFNAIKEGDLYGTNGKFPPFSYDKAIGFPILEMCPPEKLHNIDDLLYVYNVENPVRSATLKRGGGLGAWYRKKKHYGILKR